MNALPEIVRWFSHSVPYVLVTLVFAVIALVRWKRHPGVSLLVLLSCGIELFSTLVLGIVQYYLLQENRAGWTDSRFALLMDATGWARTLLGVIASVLLVCAVFGWRNQTAPRPYDEPRPDRKPDVNQYGEIDRGRSEDIRKPHP